MEAQRRIVVGVDGSDCSELALKWAGHRAAQDGATLVVVTSWTRSPPPIAYPYAGFPDHNPVDLRQVALDALNETVKAVLPEHPNLSVELVAEPGDPAKVLIKQSQDADLVVVGVRGNSGIGEWLVGSVSKKVVHHAQCSVAVIRWGAYWSWHKLNL